MTQVRVNIRSVVNAAAIRHETRNGREIIVVPSATLPDNVIMNGIKYPADEIEKSYMGLDRTPAPLGHPIMNGEYVSASDPEAAAAYGIGAWNENPRRDKGIVYLDKVIDVEVANQSAKGREVIAAINEGKPVHTSTGLVGNLFDAEDDSHKNVIRNMCFDHDAILLNEDGAATPEQGVGMMVNGEKIQVVNSVVEMAEDQLDWALMAVVDALDSQKKAGLVGRLKATLLEALSLAPVREITANGDAEMTDNSQFDELSAQVNALTKANEGMAEVIANAVKEATAPLLAANAALVANAEAAEAAELAGLVEAIVKANVMTQEVAETLTLNQARDIAPKAKTAAALNSATLEVNGSKNEFDDFEFAAGKEA